MTERHTPGPWASAVDSYGKAQHSRKYKCVYAVERGERGTRITAVAARVEKWSDARLIAAAPELYEALAGLVDYMTFLGVEEDAQDKFEAANEALAKARGEVASG